jgi:hypothetical protein
MSRRHYTILAMALLAMAGCAEEKAAGDKAAADVKTAAAQPAPKPAAKGKAATKTQAQEDPTPVLSVPEGFKYDPRGRRDPFVNPVPKPVAPPPEVPVIRPDGLPGVLVAEAKIGGIVTSREPGMTKVIINAPGKKTYFAMRGDSLFDGIIKEIRPGEVVFTMISPSTKRPVDREAVVKTGTSAGTTAGEKK